ncbi:MAG: C39 family peptidase [Myxococcales bacterium]|nr:C39 family peptidase [Myxococcales bacterium]
MTSISPVRQQQVSSRVAAPLNQARNAQLSFEQCWPYIEQYARQYGADPHVMAGILMQESGFKNFQVHRDGTGHGLIGLDDNGLLPDFERWSGTRVGRGSSAATIPPEKQIEYLAKKLGEMSRQYGSAFAAARAWHRGPGAMNDSRGRHYESLIRAHIARLFPGGRTPPGAEVPPSGPSTPSQQPPRTQPAAPPSGAVAAGESYHIQRGDTLWAIASRLKAQGMKGSHWDIIHQIQALNPKITNPNLIYAGDTIRLPAIGGSHFTPSQKPPVSVQPPPVQQVDDDKPSVGNYKVPYINQYRPVGAERGYWNGAANCGPTSMAMVARAFGYGGNMADAQLINHLGKFGGTGSNGTSVNGIVAMARAIGKQATVKGPGPNVEWMKEQLRAGKLLVANGDYHAMPPHQNEARTSGHYVTVAGLDERGNFIVRDPADQNVRTITPAQMAHFIRSNPNGGWCISVG